MDITTDWMSHRPVDTAHCIAPIRDWYLSVSVGFRNLVEYLVQDDHSFLMVIELAVLVSHQRIVYT